MRKSRPPKSARPACVECGSARQTSVNLQRFRNARYRFRVDCHRCGCFSHYLEVGADVEIIVGALHEAAGVALAWMTDPRLAPETPGLADAVRRVRTALRDATRTEP